MPSTRVLRAATLPSLVAILTACSAGWTASETHHVDLDLDQGEHLLLEVVATVYPEKPNADAVSCDALDGAIHATWDAGFGQIPSLYAEDLVEPVFPQQQEATEVTLTDHLDRHGKRACILSRLISVEADGDLGGTLHLTAYAGVDIWGSKSPKWEFASTVRIVEDVTP